METDLERDLLVKYKQTLKPLSPNIKNAVYCLMGLSTSKSLPLTKMLRKDLKVPVVFFFGEDDQDSWKPAMNILKIMGSSSSMRIISSAGHFLFLESAE